MSHTRYDDLTELVATMTLDEKVGQLSLYSADVSWGGDAINPIPCFETPQHRFDAIRAGKVTGIFNVHGRERVQLLQRIAVEESRLGIPLLIGADVIHGFRTAFPVPLAEAASFEPHLAERTAAASAAEAAAEGVNWTFAPGADICRDARWGRAVESYGEDPLLAGLMAAARVRGFQGKDLADGSRLMATVKHFAGYGAAEAGLDYNTAEISRTTFADQYLPPYRAAINAGAGAVMSAFNDVEGIPATANQRLLTEILRENWGFEGFTVSDFSSDIETIAHGLAETPRDAARLCFLAGLDMCMQSGLYADHLPALVASGEIDERAVDQAVLRVLRAKQALGLFDCPLRGLDRQGDARKARALARETAGRCVVLLKNDRGVLPLQSNLKVALIGPFASDHQHLNGAWAIFADHLESVSLDQGIAQAPDLASLRVEPGSAIERPLGGGIEAAVAAARDAHVVILALGEGQHMSAESRSRADPCVPEPQMALARAVRQAGKPIVTLLRTGRPLVVPELVDLSDAVLVTWFLGAETGNAVADLLFGRTSPSGRLPMSFPRHVGQLPMSYAHKATGRPATHARAPFTTRYIDVAQGPLFPFGHGLTYGRADYGPTNIDRNSLGWNDTLKVSCIVTETAGHQIEELVQLYVRDIAASRVRPVRELKGFQKRAIAANCAAEVGFALTRADLVFDNGAGERIAEPGAFQVWIAPDAEGGTPTSFVLEGPKA